MAVMVVTDSSARLPADLAKTWGIDVVPLHILIDGADLRDGVDEVPADIHERHATTAGATPTELCAAYQRALTASGGDGVVAVHISAALSGTLGAAHQAAEQLGPAVAVVDSKSAAMGTGFVALAAARSAVGGADLDTVAAEARAAVQRGHGYIVVHRLDNLRRSGRIGRGTSWLGTALSLKPLLRIDDGKLVLAQRVRTATKAVSAMLEQVCLLAGDRPAVIAVQHVHNVAGAAEFVEAVRDRLPACTEPIIVTDLGPVLALHVGAGAIAVSLDVPD
ncbi:MAG: DegV family protein [Mycobacterium sp.]